ncbi:uncharacterized protein L203_105785 [Cryptococcus depauperatus CBS 7841]|uniref:Uncharacterized protein n=1 Tax=Cryptococcus depauperatus CBS 7841 TaxID=1295531 RepID=A0A1E3IA91_9TREE|nr:hypothetical protein L203_04923 [Cryptococcus depauperatus CBS 7841]ODN89779.1 hypothetical protein L204_06049 [Cryptococcus depauperatus CBS 7855]
MPSSSKPPDATDSDQDRKDARQLVSSAFHLLPPRANSFSSTNTTLSDSSHSSSGSWGPRLTTPELTTHGQLPPICHLASPTSSPSSSTASTAHSKGESTPRAEINAPVWPLSIGVMRKTEVYDDPMSMGERGTCAMDAPTATVLRNASLKRTGSWRKKHASLDTPPNAPHRDPSFPNFTSLSDVPPLAKSQQKIKFLTSRSSAPMPPSDSTFSEDVTHHYQSQGLVSSNQEERQRAHSPSATGCEISAPKAPPVGYPLSSFYERRRNSSSSGLAPTTSSSASVTSSSSGKSFSHQPTTPPPAPRWACPPAVTNSCASRALSFGSGQNKPDINLDDFDLELFEGQEDEWIEVIKGAEGRIAIKSTPSLYVIMVWLPGFSIDNITIATRGHRTVHIVADQWDEGDHAQWDIKLGEDANLKSVNAKFTGKELRVTVTREIPEWQKARLHNTSRSNRPHGFNVPSITATTGYNPLDRATTTHNRA